MNLKYELQQYFIQYLNHVQGGEWLPVNNRTDLYMNGNVQMLITGSAKRPIYTELTTK